MQRPRTASPVHVADRSGVGGRARILPPIFMAAESDPCCRLPITMKPSGGSRSLFSLAILRLGICTTQPPSLSTVFRLSRLHHGQFPENFYHNRRQEHENFTTWKLSPTHFSLSNEIALLVEGTRSQPLFFCFLFTSPLTKWVLLPGPVMFVPSSSQMRIASTATVDALVSLSDYDRVFAIALRARVGSRVGGVAILGT